MEKPLPIILAVDDNRQNLAVVEKVLSAANYKILTAMDGQTALDLIKSASPDLVLLDVMMPGMSGYEVCKQIRADETTRLLPVVMLTSLSDVSDRIEGIEAGADDFLGKPFNREELLARVRSLIRVKQLHDALEELNRTLEERVQQQVREIERISRLKRYLSPQIAGTVLESEDDDLFKSHRREITAIFLDLRGFTAFSDSSEPEEVMALLRSYHAEMGRLIFQFEGTLEHFAGDGIMVFFNDPIPHEDHTEKAARMAIELRDKVRELRTGWLKRGYDLDLGVGMAAGYATLGAIGFESRMDYGAVGNVTILAFRLSSEAKGGQILIDQKTLSKIENLVEVELLDKVHLKGFTRPVTVFNIVKLSE